MKKVISLCLALLLCACFAACAADSTAAQSTATVNGSTATTNGDAVASTEPTAEEQEAVVLTVTPSQSASTLTVTGQMVDYFIALTDSYTGDEQICFCVQFETTEGAFADFRWHFSADTSQFVYLEYSAGEWVDLVGSAADGCITFTYQTGLIAFDAVDFICVYLNEGGSYPSVYEQFPVSQVIIEGEVAQAMVQDTLGIAGVYLDRYDDIALLTIGTDAFGYTANLNGTLYSLTVDNFDGGVDYLAYIATAEDGSRFCLHFSCDVEHPNMQISEYYGEAELRYACEYEPLFNEAFYCYDENLNKMESPIVYEFDGTQMNITLYGTYTTGWVELQDILYNDYGMQMAGIQLYDFPITSLADGQLYFLTLFALERDESWYPELHIQTFSICESYYFETTDEYYPNAVIFADTVISDLQTDAASVAQINDIIGVYTSGIEYNIQRADGSVYFESFEITETQIILNGNVIAEINLAELYGAMRLGGYQVIYDGDTPTHTLHIYVRGDLLDITMQEYGTVFVSSIASPPNNQTPTLAVTVSK